MSSSMFWKIFGAYLMIFYTDIFGLSAAAVGVMFAVTRVWDSVFDPVVGVVADRTESRWVGCSKFRYKSDIKSARIQLVKLLTFNTLYCEIVL